MSDLQNQVIEPFLEDIWGNEDKCIHPLHEEDCNCLFDYYAHFLEKAVRGQDKSFEWVLYKGEKVDKKELIKVVLRDILDEDIEEKAEQLLLMYKSYKN